MKTYEEFTGELLMELKGATETDYSYSFSESPRLNGVIIHTLTVTKKGCNISPCIHLDYFFDEYKNGREAADIAKSISGIIEMQPSFSKPVPDLNWEKVKDNIIYSLINYDANPDLISRLPHFRLSDLAVIFRIDASFMEFDGFINVNHALLKVFNKTREELLMTAKQNMNRLLPLRIIKMSEMLGVPTLPEESELLICTNSEKSYGASGVLYDELGKHLEYEEDTDYYIIPSSIHETLLLKCRDYGDDPSELKEIVRSVNMSEAVSASEYLSDSVYRLSSLREEFSSLLPSM